MPWTKVFHPDQVCGPCFLFQQSKQQYYAYPATWKESLLNQLLEINNEVDKESCICRRCEWDFKNGVGNADYIPRWRHWRAKDVPKCIVDKCFNESHCATMTAICSIDEVAEIFEIRPDISATDAVALCDEHYRRVHRHINSSTSMYCSNKVKCKTCNLVIHGAARKCGQASYIQAYYNELGFDMELDNSDKTIYTVQI